MAVNLSPLGGAAQQFFDNNGVILSGGKIYTYAAGTTTPQTTYTSSSGATPHSNPIILDSAGRVPGGEIWLTAGIGYKFGIYTALSVLIGTYDNVYGINDTANATQIIYNEGSPSAIDRTVQNRLSDEVSAKDFGTTGTAVQNAINENTEVFFPTGAYTNSTSVTLPFGKTFVFQTGANINNIGAGTTTLNGVTLRNSYNPSSLTGWTGTNTGFNYEGFAADLGGYGPRSFGPYNIPTGVSGSVKSPASSTLYGTFGVAGWIDNASTTTNAVALYGQADRRAASSLVWGLNTRTIDNGFGGLNVWGYELDMNIDNVTTTALGLDLVGGSTVEPDLSIAVNVQPIGIFATPKKRWRYGFRTTDAAAIFGIELGARAEVANSESQTFAMNYRNASNAQENALVIGVDSNGNALIKGGSASANGILAFQTFSSSLFSPIAIQGDKVGFYGNVPAVRPTVTGSRGGNAALASLLTQLQVLGLITDGTTA